jgi:hypothetical protein
LGTLLTVITFIISNRREKNRNSKWEAM